MSIILCQEIVVYATFLLKDINFTLVTKKMLSYLCAHYVQNHSQYFIHVRCRKSASFFDVHSKGSLFYSIYKKINN